jgi:hypothetical protein
MIIGKAYAIEISKLHNGKYTIEHREVDPNTNMGKGWIPAGITGNFLVALSIARGIAKKYYKREGVSVSLGVYWCGKKHDGKYGYIDGKFHRRGK